MHVFLKGPIQIGKSTAVLKSIERLSIEKSLVPCGFLTHAGLFEDFDLYISALGEPAVYDDRHRIAHRSDKGAFGITGTFDSLGVELLEDAQKKGGLICMDELGFLEKEAFQFQEAVLACLDGSVPVLGVIKGKTVPWHEKITSHPSVTVIEVTLENRSEVVDQVLAAFNASLR